MAFGMTCNEPSVFNSLQTMPDTVVHRIDEPGFAVRTATHREIHNVYGMENSRATFDGMLALRPQMRPFVLTRASYAGGQRYAATWTGDNSATWNHLRLTTSMLQEPWTQWLFTCRRRCRWLCGNTVTRTPDKVD